MSLFWFFRPFISSLLSVIVTLPALVLAPHRIYISQGRIAHYTLVPLDHRASIEGCLHLCDKTYAPTIITLLGQGPLHVEKGGKIWNPVHRYKQTVTTV